MLGAGSAEATTVSASLTTVTVNDNTSDVTDNLTFTLEDAGGGTHRAVVTDNSANVLTPSTGCVQGGSTSQVTCTHPNAAGNFLRTNVSLGGGDDRFNAASLTAFGVVLSAGDGADTITGSDTDAASAVPTANTFDDLSGQSGNDKLVSRAGDDTLDGGLDDDLMTPSEDGAQRLIGSIGEDRASYAAYTAGVNLVVGGGAVSGSAAGDTGIVRAKDQIDGDVEVLQSGAGADTLVGDADPERFDPGNKGDSVDGNGGIDEVTYESRPTRVRLKLGGTAGTGASEDTITEAENLTGGGGDDRLTGDDGPNLLEGNGGADILSAGGDDDVIVGGFGADDQIGGDGVDEATYRDRTDAVTVTVGPAGASGNPDDGTPGNRDRVRSDVERVVGGSDDDVITGDGNANQLQGAGGADQLDGTGGNDVLNGGSGPDSMIGGGGTRDEVTYIGRTDQLFLVQIGGTPGASGGRVDGPEGARDTIAADVEDLTGGAGADTLVGSAAANGLDGGQGGDNMQGLGGSDTVTYEGRALPVAVTVGSAGASGSSFDGGSGNRDTINLDIETVIGTSFNDTLNGADGRQILQGGDGNDTLAGGDENDLFIGNGDLCVGPQNPVNCGDTVTYAGASGGVTVTVGANGASGNAQDGAAGSRDTIRDDIERVIGTSSPDTMNGDGNANELEGGQSDDTFAGNGGDDRLEGSQGADTFEGGPGDDDMFGSTEDDTFDGGPGADLMDGSTSTAPSDPGDTVRYNDRSEDLNVNVDGGAVSGSAVDESLGVRDQLVNIETLIGGTGNDTLARTSATLGHFFGGDGNDTLTGGGSVDRLFGEQGIDTLDGGVSNDLLDGGTQGDDLVGGTNNDTLLGGDDDDELSGGLGLDVLAGGQGPDLLEGDGDADDLDGGPNADVLIGGFGSDLIDGSGGIDQASYADRATNPATAGVSATIGATGGSGNADDGAVGARDTISTDVENLLGGVGADTLIGNSGPNQIDGAGGGDEIRGGQGIDELLGGLGNDSLFSRDLFADTLACDGGGGDSAEVDASDTVNPDCEDVAVG
jgi:Ca2+-binding RTX toxin-like protein